MLLILNLGCDFELGDVGSKWINEIVFSNSPKLINEKLIKFYLILYPFKLKLNASRESS